MKSSFEIDFADLTGNGIEPIIRIEIGDETMEDKLLKTLFQSTDKLHIFYNNKDEEGYKINSNIILSKSEVNL